MILKNRRTRKTLEIEYSEFRNKFANEIEETFQSFRKIKLNKYPYVFKDDNSLEFDFYFDFQWNFNNFSNSAWYIDKM